MNRLALEIVGGVALLGMVILWWVDHNHREQQIGIKECQAEVASAVNVETAKQAVMAAQYEKQKEAADAAHAAELANIQLRVIRTPVWLRAPGSICSDEVPRAAAPAASVIAGAGGTQPSPRDIDIRPGIEAFKARIETVVADCRDALAKWPSVAAP
jgi:hypothetical protein